MFQAALSHLHLHHDVITSLCNMTHVCLVVPHAAGFILSSTIFFTLNAYTAHGPYPCLVFNFCCTVTTVSCGHLHCLPVSIW